MSYLKFGIEKIKYGLNFIGKEIKAGANLTKALWLFVTTLVES